MNKQEVITNLYFINHNNQILQKELIEFINWLIENTHHLDVVEFAPMYKQLINDINQLQSNNKLIEDEIEKQSN